MRCFILSENKHKKVFRTIPTQNKLLLWFVRVYMIHEFNNRIHKSLILKCNKNYVLMPLTRILAYTYFPSLVDASFCCYIWPLTIISRRISLTMVVFFKRSISLQLNKIIVILVLITKTMKLFKLCIL